MGKFPLRPSCPDGGRTGQAPIRRCPCPSGQRLSLYKPDIDHAKFIADGISDLKPRDNIDVQSFMYVVGTDGYVREAIQA